MVLLGVLLCERRDLLNVVFVAAKDRGIRYITCSTTHPATQPPTSTKTRLRTKTIMSSIQNSNHPRKRVDYFLLNKPFKIIEFQVFVGLQRYGWPDDWDGRMSGGTRQSESFTLSKPFI